MSDRIYPELLAPAGDWERLQSALLFGADAVYLAGQTFGMRAGVANFSEEQMAEAVRLCHEKGVRVYVTVNTLPRNGEVDRLPDTFARLAAIGVDAVIVSDIGVLGIAKRYAPSLEVHISTQAGIVNHAAASAFYDLGAKRVVLARELSLEEIAEIRAKTPAELELEAFVHGAMCMSFSGRCVLSNYLTGRDANRGECAQPCRWSYALMEEKRPGEYFPIQEDGQGSYILNAKDLCMIEHIDRLAEAGIASFKIEGRAKSSYYVSVVTNAYRVAIDDYRRSPQDFALQPWLLDEVKKVSHRRYSTGFYFDRPDQYTQNGGYIRSWDIVAVVTGQEDDRLFLTQKNKFSEGEPLELLVPGEKPFAFSAEEMKDGEGAPISAAPHPEMPLSIRCEHPAPVGSILRKPSTDRWNGERHTIPEQEKEGAKQQ